MTPSARIPLKKVCHAFLNVAGWFLMVSRRGRSNLLICAFCAPLRFNCVWRSGSFIKDPTERGANADELFSLIADGTLKVEINQRYALCNVADAHRELASRKTIGSSILTI